MRSIIYVLSISGVLLIPLLLFAQKQSIQKHIADIDIPYKKYVLENGLTLLVHEDHKAPIVAVNVWYHVGSKNEKVGKTGFAHLFEHLMFNGSENFNDDYFQALERVGATNLNGTTNEDRTNYFQNVPTSALDLVLWLESDRMGHLLGAVDQAKLDEQRGVVKNEKRQGDNEPYAVAWDLIVNATWPANHPYAHRVIGSMEDLDGATLDDVHEWFKTYYGAANATLVIAGDVNPDTVFEKVKRYFGDIPSGPPVAHFKTWIAKRTGEQRQQVYDRVPQARIIKVWNIPQWGSHDGIFLDLVSDVLSSGKTSRLYKRLVYDEQIATNVSAFVDLMEIAGQFYIDVLVKQGVDPSTVERAINEELEKFLKSGPTEKELQRVKTQYTAGLIRGLERIGGFGGKTDILAMSQVFAGDPDAWKKHYQIVLSASRKDLHRAANDWLSDGVYTLTILPFPQFSSSPTDTLLRKTMPVPKEPPEGKLPALKRATLSNGLRIILAERKSIPTISLTMLFDAGYAADQFGLLGTANLAMNMLDEGTTSRTALDISEELAQLGATLSTSCALDVSSVSMSALKMNLDASLALFADVILHPSFPQSDFERLQKLTLASIQREKAQPFQMGLRVIPQFLYGKGHAYSVPLTGTGTEESINSMKREDMLRFHQTWIRPNNGTLLVVGDITFEELLPKLEKLFKEWKPAPLPIKNINHVNPPSQSTVYIMDKPGAEQSIVFAAQIAPPKNWDHDIALDVLNTILGGAFTSRINMNIREEKHWSYGARTTLLGARGQRPYIAYAPVQIDKTKETMIEIKKEFDDILSKRPVTNDELEKVKNNMILQLPGRWETNDAILSSIAHLVIYNLPDNFYDTYTSTIRNLTCEKLTEVAKIVLIPSSLVWIVVGDRHKIEPSIRELNFGELHFIDRDGNILQ
ncbi:MAG: insulinase family protein [Bacteroidetes bacterium]|nr:insulinase family protein [Bacteroidota bacterium]